MSWLSGFFGGSNPTLNSQISGLGQIGATQSGIGATDTSAASTFFQNILAGNTKSIAPQINSIQKQGSEKLKTLSEFGNRSGGTNSEAATTGDKTTASINDFRKSLLMILSSSWQIGRTAFLVKELPMALGSSKPKDLGKFNGWIQSSVPSGSIATV
jgi:hypothetical protein